MDDKLAILLENFRETLRRSDKYVKLATGAAVFFLMIALTWKRADAVSIPGFLAIDRASAVALVLTVFWISTLMAAYAVERARRMLFHFEAEPQLFYAVMTYPALATERWPAVRYAAVLLPLAVVLIGLGQISWFRAPGDFDRVFAMTTILAAPTAAQLAETWLFSKAIPKD